ncbi:hypothetical protein [Nocardia sp. NRRL S-836]|nr:hypothetical protein [Nocardia sp. NRRL S-836]
MTGFDGDGNSADAPMIEMRQPRLPTRYVARWGTGDPNHSIVS